MYYLAIDLARALCPALWSALEYRRVKKYGIRYSSLPAVYYWRQKSPFLGSYDWLAGRTSIVQPSFQTAIPTTEVPTYLGDLCVQMALRADDSLSHGF